MKAITLPFSLVLILAEIGHAAMGPAFSTGPVGSGSWIREATSTLIVPHPPHRIVGNSVLWTGMGTDNGDLIQAINNNYPPDDLGAVCSHLGTNWCVAATTLHKTSNTTQQEIAGINAISSPGAQVTMHYIYNDNTAKYDQFALINGIVVSNISTASGHAMGWGTANECTTKPCGLVPAHTWINTFITLNTPDPNYASTNSKGPGVTGNLTTPDGGQTWTVSVIEIPEWDFTTL